nr:multifunctional oxoglutarate decarboxylase/oxoglutarate dehydrogenase thiamine pyrophosphate-binding subunit/dihydrolipoyllysine-residue succinyltransferase subunit [Actinomycetes bacterium]
YRTGGTIHIVVNNQIGFTTAPEYSRSAEYCTDVAKMVGSPIFHVNGDDPEACAWVARLAVDFRQEFGKDVIIDMLCYRRRGHNEGDDPSMTNPAMYDVIDTKRGVRKSYTEALIGRGDISMKEAEDALRDYQGQLEQVFNEVRELEKHEVEPSESVEMAQMIPRGMSTAVDKALLARIGDAHLAVPEGFTVHPRVRPVLEKRREMAYEGKVDWAFAELLALGTVLAEGKLIRMTGQDTRRGTFTQRHAVIIDPRTGAEFTPLDLLTLNPDGTPNGGRFLIYDSPLSEYAAVGFEYGYSVGNPKAIVLWEAQFGDFVNGAQSIIDEFISSGEAKWGQRSDVVLLLPHGHEGQGPDHTSGRIERFLQLWAEGSMTIAMPSTPANYFHLLRRHGRDEVHRPLIVFTPKSMLRNKAAVSDIRDFTEQKFRSIMEEPTYTDGDGDRNKATRMLLTSGKIYYELEARKVKDGRDDVAIVRVEQLAPLPKRRLAATLDEYPNVQQYFWVQEEPANQGAWPTFGLTLPELLPEKLTGIKRISRRAMSAPSSGSSKVHAVEQREILDEAFG